MINSEQNMTVSQHKNRHDNFTTNDKIVIARHKQGQETDFLKNGKLLLAAKLTISAGLLSQLFHVIIRIIEKQKYNKIVLNNLMSVISP